MPSPRPPRRGQSLADANLPEIIARLIDYVRSITPAAADRPRLNHIFRNNPVRSKITAAIRSGPGPSPYASYFRVKDASYEETA